MKVPCLLLHVGRRSISTGLASAFNKIHADLRHCTNFKRTGLFNIDELQEAEGFLALKDEALYDANRLVHSIVANPQEERHIVPLFDNLSNCLCKVADLAEFIRVAHPQPRYREFAEQASMDISGLVEKLNTDRRLYDALKNSKYHDEIDEYVAKLFMFDFEQSGIHLPAHQRDRVLELNEAILRLGSMFASNANRARLMDPNQLPEKIRHLVGQNTDRTFLTSLYADSDDPSIRETAYRLHLQYDKAQDDILTNMLKCRHQLAQLCGFPSYGHRAIKGGIAGSPEVVRDFLGTLSERIREPANRDYAELLRLKQRCQPSGSNMKLNAWDVPYYSASYKRSKYNEQVMQCLPYFSVGVCMDGLNMIFRHLYRVRMQVDSCKRGELWDDDVIKLSIIDEENDDEPLGYIYCDLFERPLKAHQDCHHTIRGGCQLADGSYQKPIVVLVLSLPESSGLSGSGGSTSNNRGQSNPALLTPSMVDNLFHEMGHAMHSMLARTKYQHITGTRCSTDLAEVPSILMELFSSDPRVVSKFARHYSTGSPMPDELIKCWIKSKRLFIASETQLQLFYAALDQAYHGPDVFKRGESTTDILARCQKSHYSIDYVPGTAWQLRFSHLVGYGAKYYSYLVSRSIATAIWKKLFARDPLNRVAGMQYKEQVLRHGGGKPPDEIASQVLECDITAEFMASSLISSLREPLFV